jgi:alginate O-acetyltransferase complex protein AlgI
MSLIQTLLLVAVALLIRLVFPGKNRSWVILAVSIVAIYWLQPALPIRQLDFWFPTTTLGFVFLSWGLTAEKNAIRDCENLKTMGFTFSIVMLIALTRYVSLEGIITASRPPKVLIIALVFFIFSGLTVLLVQHLNTKKTFIVFGIFLILCIFLILKNPLLANYSSIQLRFLFSQNPTLAKKTDLGWLGFSYLSFRIIHVLIDRLHGRLKDIKLGEYLIFTIFYPSFLAGPLDRMQRFRRDFTHVKPITSEDTFQNLARLSRGLFRKFILADSLSVFAISSINSAQVKSSGWLWVMTIAYSFQLFLDFAGYTDIAIAAGGLLGFNLPENFNRPYLQPNLTQFWNRWHISLTQWIRAYFFNPLARYMRRNSQIPVTIVILITQLSTMIVIGLWHGISLNFFIWGIWHGFGLFIHNRWSNTMGLRIKSLGEKQQGLQHFIHVSSLLLTFFYTSIGWVWFSLPEADQAWQTLLRLFGRG